VLCRLSRRQVDKSSSPALFDNIAKAMLFEFGGNKCITLPPTKKLKVISAEYNVGSDAALPQVVGADITSAEGSWTFSIGAIPVSQ
jgi:hypothetical protein